MPISQNELDSFHHFASHELELHGAAPSWEELLEKWRIRQEHAETVASIRRGVEDEEGGRLRELADIRAKIHEAKMSSRRGESTELDVDRLVQEVTDELAAEGIRD